jgi:hypothetical protein
LSEHVLPPHHSEETTTTNSFEPSSRLEVGDATCRSLGLTGEESYSITGLEAPTRSHAK